ncbi:MAG: hypothetical protein ACE5DN_05635 [Flavobacteriales bacterium]
MLVSMWMLPACHKSDRDFDKSTNASTDNTLAQTLFNSLMRQLHEVAMNDTFTNPSATTLSFDNCVDSVTLLTTGGGYPATLSVYYNGSAACDDGFVRSGELQISAGGNYTDSLSVYTVTPINYYSDSMLITGKLTVRNKGKNGGGNSLFSVDVSDGVIRNDTMRVEWSCRQNWEWTAGASTAAVTDDVFLISGTSDGRARKGNLFSTEVVTPLHAGLSCKWIGEGEVKVLPNNLSIRLLDYGNGACDKSASVTINGKTYDIVMY